LGSYTRGTLAQLRWTPSTCNPLDKIKKMENCLITASAEEQKCNLRTVVDLESCTTQLSLLPHSLFFDKNLKGTV
jgi:hypothetical protein